MFSMFKKCGVRITSRRLEQYIMWNSPNNDWESDHCQLRWTLFVGWTCFSFLCTLSYVTCKQGNVHWGHFCPPRALFCGSHVVCSSTTFLTNCGRGESLRTATYPLTVVGVSKGMLPVEYLCPQHGHFLVSLRFHEDPKTVTEFR